MQFESVNNSLLHLHYSSSLLSMLSCTQHTHMIISKKLYSVAGKFVNKTWKRLYQNSISRWQCIHTRGRWAETTTPCRLYVGQREVIDFMFFLTWLYTPPRHPKCRMKERERGEKENSRRTVQKCLCAKLSCLLNIHFKLIVEILTFKKSICWLGSVIYRFFFLQISWIDYSWKFKSNYCYCKAKKQ